MKKLLLSTLALSAAMAGFSQSNLYIDGAVDDFTSADEVAVIVPCEDPTEPGDDPAYAGVYWWDGSTSETEPNTEAGGCDETGGDDCDATFTSVKKDREVGGQTYTITQPYGSFEPIGVGFGEYDNSGTDEKFTLDLSGDANMSFTFQAGPGDPEQDDASETVKVTFQLQDINTATTGRSLGLMSTFTGSTGGESWRNDIGFAHDNGNGVVSINAPHTFTFDWSTAKTVILNGDGSITYEGDPATSSDFQLDKVVAVTVTVTNGSRRNSGDDSYDPYKWSGDFTITNFEIGNTDSDKTYDYVCYADAVNDEYLASLINVAPNPTSGEAVIDLGSLNGEIRIIDPLSKDITAEVLTGNMVNLAGKDAGIYFVIVNTPEGTAVKRISKQ